MARLCTALIWGTSLYCSYMGHVFVLLLYVARLCTALCVSYFTEESEKTQLAGDDKDSDCETERERERD